MSFAAFMASLVDTQLIAVAHHWNAARGDRLAPAWRDIDPTGIGPHLSIIWAWRWDEDEQAFIGRLAGADIEQVLNARYRGSRMVDVFGEKLALTMHDRALRIMREPATVHSIGRLVTKRKVTGVGERIVLPLGGEPGGVLGATVYRQGDYERLQGVGIDDDTEVNTFFSLRP